MLNTNCDESVQLTVRCQVLRRSVPAREPGETLGMRKIQNVSANQVSPYQIIPDPRNGFASTVAESQLSLLFSQRCDMGFTVFVLLRSLRHECTQSS